MSDEIYIQTLRQYFGYEQFRSIQLDIIRSIGSSHDTLGLMPTGGGKSITFQVPALAMEGVCVVITPLIALMNDQVAHLQQLGIKAEAIHSELAVRDIERILDNAIYGAVKFLYLSPERLSHPLFLAKLFYMNVCLFVVDEAHCISQWGYDFRPAYLHIAEIRQKKPDVPMLALTASATPIVVRDIQEKLLFGLSNGKESHVFRMSFRRENLAYVVRNAEDKEQQLLHILHAVDGSAIVYTRSREKTKNICDILQDNGIAAAYYHAGLDRAIKDTWQEEWQEDKLRVIVATNAFGMGIDKPDVRLVIHFDCPDSLEAYYQEAGRAGRDGKKAYAVLLYNRNDRVGLLRRCKTAFPPREYIRKVYDHLAYFFQQAVDSGAGERYVFDEGLFCSTFHHYPAHLEPAISILQNAGYIQYDTDPTGKTRVRMNVRRDELYEVNDISPLQNNVITALFRLYGSLFVDFTYIDDGHVAKLANTDVEHLHIALKDLSRRGILTFIPPRRLPTIMYTRDRIDSERLVIGRNVYEDLQKTMTQRINAVVRYAEDNTTCRQEMLSDYFGEEMSRECGKCDVCVARQGLRDKSVEKTRGHVLDLLNDCKSHSMEELNNLMVPQDALRQVLEVLLDEGLMIMDGPFVRLQQPQEK